MSSCETGSGASWVSVVGVDHGSHAAGSSVTLSATVSASMTSTTSTTSTLSSVVGAVSSREHLAGGRRVGLGRAPVDVEAAVDRGGVGGVVPGAAVGGLARPLVGRPRVHVGLGVGGCLHRRPRLGIPCRSGPGRLADHQRLVESRSRRAASRNRACRAPRSCRTPRASRPPGRRQGPSRRCPPRTRRRCRRRRRARAAASRRSPTSWDRRSVRPWRPAAARRGPRSRSPDAWRRRWAARRRRSTRRPRPRRAVAGIELSTSSTAPSGRPMAGTSGFENGSCGASRSGIGSDGSPSGTGSGRRASSSNMSMLPFDPSIGVSSGWSKNGGRRDREVLDGFRRLDGWEPGGGSGAANGVGVGTSANGRDLGRRRGQRGQRSARR